MEVSKFKIGENLIDIKDAQARDDAVAAMNAAQDAQSTADRKQDAATALKAAKASGTFTNVSIPAGSDYQFNIPLPSDIANVKLIYARTTSLSLVPTNMYRAQNTAIVYLGNISNTAITASSVTVEVTYLYE